MKLRVAKKIDSMEDLPRYFRRYKGSTRSKAAARMRKFWYRDPEWDAWLTAPLTQEETEAMVDAYEALVAESP